MASRYDTLMGFLRGGAEKGMDLAGTAYQQQKAAERQNQQIESEMAAQQADRDFKLSQLIKQNELERGDTDYYMGKAMEMSKRLPGATVNIGAKSASINPEDPLAKLFKMKAMETADEEKLARKTEALGKMVEKSGTANLTPALNAVYKSWQGGKSVSPGMNMIPTAGLQSAAANFFKGPEAGAEFQALQNLTNMQIKEMSGTAVNKMEEGRQLVSRGMSAGGNPELVKKGVALIQEANDEHLRNIQGSFPEKVRQAYASNRGIKDFSEMGPDKEAMAKFYAGSSPKESSAFAAPPPGMLRVRHKATGQTGSVPVGEFNEQEYERL